MYIIHKTNNYNSYANNNKPGQFTTFAGGAVSPGGRARPPGDAEGGGPRGYRSMFSSMKY